jgi:GTP cyclohydrolase II
MREPKPNKSIINQAETLLPTEWGDLILSAFADKDGDPMPHLSLRHPDLDISQAVVTRVHSECLTGDIFHSQKCDCGEQLLQSMKVIHEQKGILIYLRQEGRGIGIINKIKAYRHQEQGLDTIEANEVLGFETDYRNYTIAADILKSFDISKIKLLTNNPDKINKLDDSGIEVVDRLPLEIEPNNVNRSYLETKADAMGHLLNLK